MGVCPFFRHVRIAVAGFVNRTEDFEKNPSDHFVAPFTVMIWDFVAPFTVVIFAIGAPFMLVMATPAPPQFEAHICGPVE